MDTPLLAACLGLSITLAEWFNERKASIKFIRHSQCSPAKALYLISRIVALIIHCCTICLLAWWKTHWQRSLPNLCYSYLMFQGVSCLLMVSVLDVILILRVYALYNQSFVIVGPVILLFLVRIPLGAWAISRWAEGGIVDDVYLCLGAPRGDHKTRIATITHWTATVFFQIIVHTLTLNKTSKIKGAWSARATLPSIVTRDGVSVFVAILGLMTAAVLAMSLKDIELISFVFPLTISLLSSAGCRMITRLQSLGGSSEDSPEIVGTAQTLSTLLENSVWDVRTDLDGAHFGG